MKGLQSKIRDKLISVWMIIIMVMNLIHISVALNALSVYNSEISSGTGLIGLATLMSIVALNKYLLWSPDYAHLPSTMISSGKSVIFGCCGILPILIGVGVVSSTFLYS